MKIPRFYVTYDASEPTQKVLTIACRWFSIDVDVYDVTQLSKDLKTVDTVDSFNVELSPCGNLHVIGLKCTHPKNHLSCHSDGLHQWVDGSNSFSYEELGQILCSSKHVSKKMCQLVRNHNSDHAVVRGEIVWTWNTENGSIGKVDGAKH